MLRNMIFNARAQVKNDAEKKNDIIQPSQKFSNLQILTALMIGNTNTLRESGYNPKSLYESSKLSFEDHQKLRGQAQCHVMTRFKPNETEASIYEKSGDLLASHALPVQAREHLQIAFDHDHRPFDMTMNLGQASLKQGYLPVASQAFDYLSKQMPNIPYVYNELGVAKFMMATQQSKPEAFAKHRLEALSAFDCASELAHDPVVDQNKRVTSLLAISPNYGLPFNYLQFTKGSSTRMIDAIMHDLANHKMKAQASSGIGFSYAHHHESGGPTLAPVITTTHYLVPNVPNQQALYELEKIKQEQLSEEMTRTMKL